MFPLSMWTLPTFIALIATSGVSVLFFVSFLVFGKRILDLLFSGWMACAGAYCVATLAFCNVVPPSATPYDVPQAAAHTLFWFRVCYVVGLIAIAFQLHFVLFYCGRHNRISRHILAAYALCLAVVPVIWSDWFLRARAQPLSAGPPGRWVSVPAARP